MRITIFGATGLLGKALMREWREDDVTGFGSADGDIRDEKQVLSLVQRTRPDWIVLAAAYTDVDGCETNRDLAFDVNCKRSGQRGACSQAVRWPPAFHQHRLRIRWNQNDSLRDGRPALTTQRLRQIESRGGDSTQRDPARVLHRSDLLAFWGWREVLSLTQF